MIFLVSENSVKFNWKQNISNVWRFFFSFWKSIKKKQQKFEKLFLKKIYILQSSSFWSSDVMYLIILLRVYSTAVTLHIFKLLKPKKKQRKLCQVMKKIIQLNQTQPDSRKQPRTPLNSPLQSSTRTKLNSKTFSLTLFDSRYSRKYFAIFFFSLRNWKSLDQPFNVWNSIINKSLE